MSFVLLFFYIYTLKKHSTTANTDYNRNILKDSASQVSLTTNNYIFAAVVMTCIKESSCRVICSPPGKMLITQTMSGL